MISFRRIKRFFPGFLVLLLIVLGPLSAWSQTGPWVTVLDEKFEGVFPGTSWELIGQNIKLYLPIVTKNFTASASGTFLNEDFKGTFPGTSLELIGQNNLSALPAAYLWGKRDCRKRAGSSSGWGVGGGTAGATLPCGSKYPNNVDSWMITEKYDLTGATDAKLEFYLWQNSEATLDTDTVCSLASIDNVDFWGKCTYGASVGTDGWEKRTLDLKNVTQLGDISHASQVWIALVFHSNGSINLAEGAYVDDILLSKCTASGGCAVAQAASLADSPAQSSLLEKAAHFRRPSN